MTNFFIAPNRSRPHTRMQIGQNQINKARAIINRKGLAAPRHFTSSTSNRNVLATFKRDVFGRKAGGTWLSTKRVYANQAQRAAAKVQRREIRRKMAIAHANLNQSMRKVESNLNILNYRRRNAEARGNVDNVRLINTKIARLASIVKRLNTSHTTFLGLARRYNRVNPHFSAHK